MIIKKAYIEEYGALREKSFDFLPGFNLLTGDNESGKSTLCAFIKFILYGHTDAKEREKCVSKNGIATGYLVIEANDEKTYRIERREIDGKSKVSVFNESDSSLIKDKSVINGPGEYFLGIPEKLYTRSVFISQTGTPELDRQSSEALGNLMSSGSDDLNVKRAKSRLDDMRKDYKLIRGNGGLIPETEKKLLDVRERLRVSVEKKLELSSIQAEISKHEQTSSALDLSLTNAEKAEADARIAHSYSLIKELYDTENRLKETTIKREKLISEYSENGFLPDEAHISELISLEKELVFSKEKASSIESVTASEPKAPSGFDIWKFSDENQLKSTLISASNRKNCFLILLIITAFIAAMTTAAALSAATFPALGCINGALCLIFAVLFLITQKKFNTVAEFHGCRTVRELDAFFETCRRYESDLSAYNSQRELRENAALELTKAQNALTEALKKWGRASVSEAISNFKNYSKQLSELNAEAENLTRSRQYLETRLSDCPVDDLSAARKLFEEGISPQGLQKNEGAIEKSTILASLSEVSARLTQLRLEYARIDGSAADDPLELSATEEALNSALSDYQKTFNALRLALDTLEEAEHSVRRTFIPQLSRLGSEYFERMTDGKYKNLGLNSDFEMNLRKDTDSDILEELHFSGGSRALAWFCLRLALISRISDAPLPLILDEPFVYYDEHRLSAALELLNELAKEHQILLFSASGREGAISDSLSLCKKISQRNFKTI